MATKKKAEDATTKVVEKVEKKTTKTTPKVNNKKEATEKKPTSKKTTAKKTERKTDSSAKKVQEKETTTKKVAVQTLVEPVKPSYEVFDSLKLGTLSEDIVSEIENQRSDREIEALLYRDLKRFEKNGEYLWGTVYGVEQINGHATICVLYNNQKVMIPAEYYFEDSYDWGKNYALMSDKEKLAKKIRAATYQIGSYVPFTVVKVTRELITSGEFAGEYEISIVGNRKAAMSILRDIFFLHKNRKLSAKYPPREAPLGSIQKAHVLAVKEDTVLVECCGVETKLFAYNLLNNKIVYNCSEHTRPGESLKVKVKKLYINDDGSVHLSITGRINEVSKLIRTFKKGCAYLGEVERYNPEKSCYTIILTGGIIASVPESNVMGRCILSRGDKVSVFVSNIYEGFVSGSAMKL